MKIPTSDDQPLHKAGPHWVIGMGIRMSPPCLVGTSLWDSWINILTLQVGVSLQWRHKSADR